ncbi:MAG: FGGY family carbohydrate kinase [Paracoccaceae bacterium]
MKYTLGIDIGTFQSKGVIVDAAGQIVASAVADHEMIVPQAGWAEHRADEDWWGDFVSICKQLLTGSDIDAGDIRCVASSAIGPCMLPVDVDGTPLMNGVLYGWIRGPRRKLSRWRNALVRMLFWIVAAMR